MIYYGIRHKVSGKLMPQMKRGRGYSHWNPGNSNAHIVYAELNIPRLLKSEKQANTVINCWFNMPNSRNDYDGDIKLGASDGRKKEDLEVITIIMMITRKLR